MLDDESDATLADGAADRRETGPIASAVGGLPEIFIRRDDTFGAPTEGFHGAAEIVLQALALEVREDLLGR